jgi:hypothetical protein
VVVHSGGGYGPPEGQFRPEQEWTWQLRDLQQDRDSDGLPDLEEARMFTNPKRADTDGDGVPDGRDGNPLAARSQIPTDLEQIRQAVFLHAFMLNSEGHWGEVVPLQIADGAPQEFNGYPGPVLCLTPEQAARWNEQSSEGHGAPTLGPVRIDAKRGEARVRFTYAPGRGGGLPGPNGCEFLLRKKRGVWVVMEQEEAQMTGSPASPTRAMSSASASGSRPDQVTTMKLRYIVHRTSVTTCGLRR